MIYRILIDHPAPMKGGRRLAGAGFGPLSDVMDERGLVAPRTNNERLRYYFTELGWRAVGRHVAAEARRRGHVVKVLRNKNPSASRVTYRDRLQVAILHKTKRGQIRPRRTEETGGSHVHP